MFHTNSSMNAALASAGAPLFDAITNTQYQGNVGLTQMTSFSHGFPADNGARSSGAEDIGGSGPSGSRPDGKANDDIGNGAGKTGPSGDPSSSSSSSRTTSSSSSSSDSSSSSSEESDKRKKKEKEEEGQSHKKGT